MANLDGKPGNYVNKAMLPAHSHNGGVSSAKAHQHLSLTFDWDAAIASFRTMMRNMERLPTTSRAKVVERLGP